STQRVGSRWSVCGPCRAWQSPAARSRPTRPSATSPHATTPFFRPRRPSMPDLPTASVVVPTHGRSDLLPTVLAPLLRAPATAEVVAVADGDDDAYAVLGRLAGRD